ncbi:thioredoxin family protein [Chitinophaga solisilvae]|uniref:thioredoxin family protein n=1 Tax=Chitinophaga solisilvae TaxID=1233460 RepID=UPI00136E4084|nr:thioredoxin family protein [Chitinophaga solisilvae]
MNTSSVSQHSEGATLIQFYATWCHPCKLLSPVVNTIEEKMSDTITVSRVDIDQEQEMTNQFHIMAVPTLVLLRGGREIWRHTGLLPEGNLRTAIAAAIAGR